MPDITFTDDDFKGTNADLDFSESDFEPKKPAAFRSPITSIPSNLVAPLQAQRQVLESGDSGMRAGTEFSSAVVADPKGFLKSIPGSVMSLAMAPGQLAYRGAADVVSKVAGQPEYGGNLEAMMRGEDQLPVQKFLASAARTNPTFTTVAKVAGDVPGLVSGFAAGGGPAWLQKLVGLGFSADMIRKTPELAKELGTEFGKPPGQRDQDKLTDLVNQAIQTGVFAPLGAVHGLGDTVERVADRPTYLAKQVAKQLDQADFTPVQKPLYGLRQLGVPSPQIASTASQLPPGAAPQVQGPDIVQGPQIPPSGLAVKRPSQTAPVVLGQQATAIPELSIPEQFQRALKSQIPSQVEGEFRPTAEAPGVQNVALRGSVEPEVSATKPAGEPKRLPKANQPESPVKTPLRTAAEIKSQQSALGQMGHDELSNRASASLEGVKQENVDAFIQKRNEAAREIVNRLVPGDVFENADGTRKTVKYVQRSKQFPNDFNRVLVTFDDDSFLDAKSVAGELIPDRNGEYGKVEKLKPDKEEPISPYIKPQGPEQPVSAAQEVREFMIVKGARPFEADVDLDGEKGKVVFEQGAPGEKKWKATVYDPEGKPIYDASGTFLQSLVRDVHEDFGIDLGSAKHGELKVGEPPAEAPEYKQGLADNIRANIRKVLDMPMFFKKGQADPIMSELEDAAGKLGIDFEKPSGQFEREQYRQAALNLLSEVEKKYGKTKGIKYASGIQKAAEVYGNVRPQPEQGLREVPVQEGGRGIQPQAVRRLPQEGQTGREVSLTGPATADRIGARFDGEVMGRWMFTALDREGKPGTTFVTKSGAPLEDVIAKYEAKRAEYGDVPDQPRPIPQIHQAAENIEPPVKTAEHALEKPIGSVTHQEIQNMPDGELLKYLRATDETGKRYRPPHKDGINYGLKFGTEIVPELQKLVDQNHKMGLDAIDRGDYQTAEAAMGRVTWLNGAIEGAKKEGPNFDLEMAQRRMSTEQRIEEESEKGAYGTEPADPRIIRGFRNGISARDTLKILSETSTDAGKLAAEMLKHGDPEGLNVMLRRDVQALRSYYHGGNDEIMMAGIREHVPTLEILHEINHGLIERKIPSYMDHLRRPEFRGSGYMEGLKHLISDKNVSPGIRALAETFQRAIEAFPDERLKEVIGDPDMVKMMGMPYGMGDLSEFISEAISRKSFQQMLDDMPGIHGKRTLWDNFIDAVRTVLGLPAKAYSLLNDFFESYSKALGESRINEGDESLKKAEKGFSEMGENFKSWLDQFNRVKKERADLYEKLQSYPEIGRISNEKVGLQELEAMPDDVRRFYRLAQFLRELQSMPEYAAYNKVMLGQSGEGVPRIGPGLTHYAANPIKTFAEKDLKPFLEKTADLAKAGPSMLAKLFSPETLARPGDVDILFKSKGDKEKFLTQAAAAMDGVRSMFEKMPDKDRIDFIDRMKTGRSQPTPQLAQAAALIREWDDRLYNEATRFKPELPYLENHLRVLWKVIPGSDQAKANLAKQGLSAEQIASKRPWRGSQGFLRKHTLEDMSEGIALGGVPVTTNPLEMFALHAEDTMKYVAANQAWEGLKATGAAQFVKRGEQPPPGFVRIQDSIAKAYFRTPEGLISSNGEWWVNEGAGRMINNYLSRDYIRQGSEGHPELGKLGRALLAIKNGTTAIELGLSPFHAVFETNEAVGSNLGLGFRKILAGRPVEGAIEVGKALFVEPAGLAQVVGAKAPRQTTAGLGELAIRYAKNVKEFQQNDPDAYNWFRKNYPQASQLIDDLFTGGGQIAMNEDYRVKGIAGFKKALAEDNYVGAVIRAVPAVNELALKPLFQTYIPRLKVGMFLKEYSFELQQRARDLQMGKITRGQLARQTWASIEDRFGELNWDNLYWNRTFKTAMQLAFRSVTWKLGNIRAFGKAIRDTGAELGVNWWKEGRAPRMTQSMGWLLGMSVITALQASIISLITTGKFPWQKAKDTGELMRNLTFPQIDAADPSQRVSIPTYWKDLVHAGHSPVDYVKSSMTGEIGRLMDVWNNRDFYGVEVYNPDDPLYKRSLDVAGHLIPQPFGLSSNIAARRTGASGLRALAGYAGFTKAPYYMSYSPAELKLAEYIRNHQPIGSKTHEVFQRGVNERIAVDAIRRKEMTMSEAVHQGLVLPRRREEVLKRARLSHLVYGLSSPEISPKEAVKVYELSTPVERKEIKTLVRNKIENSHVLTGKEKRALYHELDALK